MPLVIDVEQRQFGPVFFPNAVCVLTQNGTGWYKFMVLNLVDVLKNRMSMLKCKCHNWPSGVQPKNSKELF